MKKKTFCARLRLLILVALLLLALVGVAVGKYLTTDNAGSGIITVNAKLAESLSVQESEAVKQADGTYKLNTANIVTSNSYMLIPGVDIPKDPRIVITGKTEIPAYLYLIVECTNSALSYQLLDHWVRQGSGNTYVYADADQNPIPITTTPGAIYILQDETVRVGQMLLTADNNTDPFTFTVTLKEVTN